MAPVNLNDVILQRLAELHEDVRAVQQTLTPLVPLPEQVKDLKATVDGHEKTLARVKGGIAVMTGIGGVLSFLGWDALKHLFKP